MYVHPSNWLTHRVFLVLATACLGKIAGCTIAARFAKLQWREALAVGVLMNTKGLVELIVLYDHSLMRPLM
jgi:Kef-type K+ transport system membrane component KefB